MFLCFYVQLALHQVIATHVQRVLRVTSHNDRVKGEEGIFFYGILQKSEKNIGHTSLGAHILQTSYRVPSEYTEFPNNKAQKKKNMCLFLNVNKII